MECPRGSVCTESEHTVKTIKMALEWSKSITDGMLPIRVNQIKAANGRVLITIRDNAGQIVYRKG